MFLNTTLRTFVNPYRFPGRLLVAVETDGRQDCGVFSGRLDFRDADGFRDPTLEEKRQPTVTVEEWAPEDGYEVFEVRGLPPAREDQVLSYHFLVTSYRTRVHASFLHSEELIVTCGDSWHFSYLGVDVGLGPEFGR